MNEDDYYEYDGNTESIVIDYPESIQPVDRAIIGRRKRYYMRHNGNRKIRVEDDRYWGTEIPDTLDRFYKKGWCKNHKFLKSEFNITEWVGIDIEKKCELAKKFFKDKDGKKSYPKDFLRNEYE